MYYTLLLTTVTFTFTLTVTMYFELLVQCTKTFTRETASVRTLLVYFKRLGSTVVERSLHVSGVAGSNAPESVTVGLWDFN